QTGTFDNGGYQLECTGALEVANGAKFLLNGSSTFPTKYATLSLGLTSTVDYGGNGPQTIGKVNYGNLSSTNTGDRVLPNGGTVGIAGTFSHAGNSFTITGSTIDYNGAGTQNIIAFNYNNLTTSGSGARILPSSGKVRVSGTFTPGTNTYTITGSTIEYNGTGTGNKAQTISAFDYNNLSSSSIGDRKLASTGTIGIYGTFTPGINNYTAITGSTIEFKSNSGQTIPAFNYDGLTSSGSGTRTLASTGTIGIAGTFNSGGNSYTVTGSTVDFNGSSLQTIPSFNFNNIQLTNSSIALSGDLTIPGDITINGTLDATGGNITVSGDWTNNGTFTNGGKIITLNGSSDQTIGGTASTSFFDVVVNKSSGNIILGNAITIEKTLILTAGNIKTTSTNLITFDVDAVLSGGSSASFIDGPAAKNTNSTSSFTFAIGRGTTYRSLMVEPIDVNTSTFTAEYADSGYTNTATVGAGIDHVSTLEYFILDRSGGKNAADAYVTISWDNSSGVNTAAIADLRLAHWDGSQWEDFGNSAVSGDNTSGTLRSNLVTTFSPFTLGSSSGSNPLPIDLLSFDVAAKGMGVELKWETATEINNDYFTIEKSVDGIYFEEISDIEGAGNSSVAIKYNYTDENPYEGTSYYRLKQTDFDGKWEVFPMKAVKWGKADEFKILSVGPNPVTDQINIDYLVSSGVEVSCMIYNLQGKLLYEKNTQASKGVNNFTYNEAGNLEQGIYILVLKNDKKSISHKVMKN
ncbi:T9SS type A sorting domain-containing protein, partial [Candidatus Amoebophilus asiaticus]|nr:T9SS type A sorting domain-containing protein [Candidatus Amoebophilus asiaticus]